MAPSASMLFLSYHQLHRPTTTTEAGVLPLQRSREEDEAAPGGGIRMSVRNVLSLASLFQRRPEAEGTAEGTARAIVHERVAGEEIKSAAAAEGNKELERKFEEAVRLSCWSS